MNKEIVKINLLLASLALITQVSAGTINGVRDTSKVFHRWAISVSAGANTPRLDYGVQDVSMPPQSNTFYGQAVSGVHTDLSGTFMITHQIGAMARIGMESNPTTSETGNYSGNYGYWIHRTVRLNLFSYMAGLSLCIKPVPSRFNVNLIALFGMATQDSKAVYDSYGSSGLGGGTYSTVTPGYGYGACGYVGLALTWRLTQRLFFNLTPGGFLTSMSYYNAYNTSSYSVFSTGPTTQSAGICDKSMTILLPQISAGLSYHL
jgi:hypothetical protein